MLTLAGIEKSFETDFYVYLDIYLKHAVNVES